MKFYDYYMFYYFFDQNRDCYIKVMEVKFSKLDLQGEKCQEMFFLGIIVDEN